MYNKYNLCSISDPSIENLNIPHKYSRQNYICEIKIQLFEESLLLLLRLNDGDIFVYTSIIQYENKDFPFDFKRVQVGMNLSMPLKEDFDVHQDDYEQLDKGVGVVRKKSSFCELTHEKNFLNEQIEIQELMNVYKQEYKNVVKQKFYKGFLSCNDGNQKEINYIIIYGKQPLVLFMKDNQTFIHKVTLNLQNSNSFCQFSFTTSNQINIALVQDNQLKVLGYENSQTEKFDYHHSIPQLRIDTLPWNKKEYNIKYVETIKGENQNYLFLACEYNDKYECIILKESDYSLYTNATITYTPKQGEKIYKVKSFQNISNLPHNPSAKMHFIGVLSVSSIQQNEQMQIQSIFRLLAFDEKLFQMMSLQLLGTKELNNGIIQDFTMLYNLNSNGQLQNKLKVVLIENSYINIFEIDFHSKRLIPLLINQYNHGKQMITSIKPFLNKDIFIIGDNNKGFEAFSFIEQDNKIISIEYLGHDMFSRELEIVQFGNQMKIQVLLFDENKNIYFYNVFKNQLQEKIEAIHVNKKVSKINQVYFNKNNNQQCFIEYRVAFTDGSLAEIKITQYHEKQKFLQTFLDILVEELPFTAGLNPKEIKNIQYTKSDQNQKLRNGIHDLKNIDIFLNLTKSLQKIICNKNHKDRDSIIKQLKQNLEYQHFNQRVSEYEEQRLEKLQREEELKKEMLKQEQEQEKIEQEEKQEEIKENNLLNIEKDTNQDQEKLQEEENQKQNQEIQNNNINIDNNTMETE